MAVFNSIFIGFGWRQEFICPDAAIPDDETIRVSFRKNPLTAVVVTLTDGAGVVRTETGFILELTEEQTLGMVPGVLMADLATVKDGDDRHLGVRLTVPVVRSVTLAS